MLRRTRASGRTLGRVLRGHLCLATTLVALAGGLAGQPARANERYASIVIDVSGGRVLHARNADALRFPASLTKIMTLYLLFEDLEAGRVRLDDRFTVSAQATRQPPSKLGLPAGSRIGVEDAIKALITKSANDVAVVVAEGLAGSEAAFARRMTAKARALGMSRTSFRNASGLPDPQQVSTARDLSRLGIAVQQHFPNYYRYFSTRSFRFGKRTYSNHNKLLGRVTGVDGIKTGYTQASGFNLVTSVRRNGRHVVAVVLGGTSGKARDSHMRGLLEANLMKASSRGVEPTVAATSPREAGPLAPAPVAPPVLASPPVPRPEIASNDEPTAATIVASRFPVELIAPAPRPPASASAYAETVEAAAPPTPAPERPWVIQIGAVPTESGAEALLERAQSKARKALAAAAPMTERIEKDGEVLFRARFAGFDRASATAACRTLKKSAFACFATRN